MSTKAQDRAISSKTMAIKSRAYNQIKRYFIDKDIFSKFPQKVKMEEIEKIISEVRKELSNYKQNRRKKNKVNKLRQERGYVPKKKTSLKEYLNYQKELV